MFIYLFIYRIMKKLVKINISNSDFWYLYWNNLWRNIYYVDSSVWKVHLKANTFHCKYDFIVKLDPLMANMNIKLDDYDNCSVSIEWAQNLLIQNKSKIYETPNKLIKISTLNPIVYLFIFFFSFMFLLVFFIKKYNKNNLFQLYNNNEKNEK